MTRRTPTALRLALLLLVWAASASAEVDSVLPRDLAKQLASDTPPVVLDVRSDPEWNTGHIPGALHIPVGEVESRLAEIPRDRDVVVHCGVAPRARAAEAILIKSGHGRVQHLEGGFTAWGAAGLPVATGSSD